MENLEVLTGKTKLMFEAVLKVQNGKKMYDEGRLELQSLLGETKVKRMSPGQKSAITKKLLKSQPSGFRKDKRTDEHIKDKMIGMIHTNRQCSTKLFMKKLNLSERKVNNLLGQLKGEGKIADDGSKEDGAPHKWVFAKNAKINGHTVKKTPGGGGKRNLGKAKTVPGQHGGQIDVTDEKLVAKATNFLKTNDWVNKGKFIEAVELSPKPGNRLIEYLVKQKLIKEVHKANNPAHAKVKKIFVQALPYLEAV